MPNSTALTDPLRLKWMTHVIFCHIFNDFYFQCFQCTTVLKNRNNLTNNVEKPCSEINE